MWSIKSNFWCLLVRKRPWLCVCTTVCRTETESPSFGSGIYQYNWVFRGTTRIGPSHDDFDGPDGLHLGATWGGLSFDFRIYQYGKRILIIVSNWKPYIYVRIAKLTYPYWKYLKQNNKGKLYISLTLELE